MSIFIRKRFLTLPIFIASTILSIILILLIRGLPSEGAGAARYRHTSYDGEKQQSKVLKYVPASVSTTITKSREGLVKVISNFRKKKNNEAYFTFFCSRVGHPYAEDNFYNATRLIVWQLLHDKNTKDSKRDVVVMATKQIAKWKLDRLEEDGAIVHVVDDLQPPGTPPGHYIDLMAKLRVWEFEEYDRILYIDSDSFLWSSFGNSTIWTDEKYQTTKIKAEGEFTYKPGEKDKDFASGLITQSLPKDEGYIMAAVEDRFVTNGRDYAYFNAGIFFLKPSKQMFQRFLAVVPYIETYEGLEFMEQNLLNYVFRQDGPTPWLPMPEGTTKLIPSGDEVKDGKLIHIHRKFWQKGDEFIDRYGEKLLHKMEGFYEGWDLGRRKEKEVKVYS